MKTRVLCVLCLLLVAALAAAALSSGVSYLLSAVTAAPAFDTVCTADGCVLVLVGYGYSGSGSVAVCLPTDPCDGAFALSFFVTRLVPTDPCRMKTGTGTLIVTWSDSTTTTGSFSFKARDSKALVLTGQVTGGTNTRFASGSGLSALVTLPTDPCVGGTTSAAINLGG